MFTTFSIICLILLHTYIHTYPLLASAALSALCLPSFLCLSAAAAAAAWGVGVCVCVGAAIDIEHDDEEEEGGLWSRGRSSGSGRGGDGGDTCLVRPSLPQHQPHVLICSGIYIHIISCQFFVSFTLIVTTQYLLTTPLNFGLKQRDDTEVVDEPLYAHYVSVSGAQRPYTQELLANMVQYILLLSSIPFSLFPLFDNAYINIDLIMLVLYRKLMETKFIIM